MSEVINNSVEVVKDVVVETAENQVSEEVKEAVVRGFSKTKVGACVLGGVALIGAGFMAGKTYVERKFKKKMEEELAEFNEDDYEVVEDVEYGVEKNEDELKDDK